MAEEESEFELEGFIKQLESLLDLNSGEEHALQSKSYCASFCKLVEEYTGRWQIPLPQLRVLHNALCSFACASAHFPSDCEHVHYTLSSLALSVFELLLFVGQSDFTQDPLKGILDSFQECYSSSLGKYQNVHLLQVGQIIREGGPWASPILQAILRESQLSCDEVDRYIGSEVPVFFELRVRYLLAGDRVSEAVALAKCCTQHPSAGRHLFFLQAYLTCLWKASHCEHMHTEMAEIDGKDAVDIICNTESEEKDELLLALCRAFLSQQLHRGDMYYMWDLVFIWSKLHLRMNPSKPDLLEHSRQLMLAATNIKSIFPFMRVILAELGKEGLQFCVELCTHALQTDLHCDAVTKSLIYKTIAYLLPNDLEVCRACALLVFFLERTVEAYKTVFLHYTHPDQEYHAEASPVGNHVRFEILQVLKKGLYFDPEFWNLITLRTNCLKLMSEKVVSAALAEIMEEDKWVVPNYCSAKEPCCWSADTTTQWKSTRTHQAAASAAPKKRLHKDEKNHVTVTAKRVKARPADKTEEASSVGIPVKRRGRKPGGGAGGARPVKETGNSSLRRSFRQLDMAQENLSRQLSNRQHRHMMTRLSEKKPPKRKIRKPRWLLLEAASQAENSAPRRGRKPGRKPQQQRTSAETKQPASGAAVKNNTKQKTAVTSSRLAVRDHEAKRRKELPTNCLSAPAPDVVLEVSQPENELTGAFSENSLGRQRVVDTQKPSPTPCEKQSPIQSQPAKDKLREEVVLRARDANFLIQQLHNYARRPEVEGVVLDPQTFGSTETVVTPSSDQWELSEGPPGEFCEKTVMEIEVTSQMQSTTEMASSAEDAVEPTDVTKTEESPSDSDGQQTRTPSTPSENGVISSNADSATKASIVHRETLSAEGTECLKEAVASELTNVLRESAGSIVSVVPKELTDREIGDVPIKPIPTEDTAVSNEPSDMDIPTEPVPTKEEVLQKGSTDEGETSVAIEPVSNKDIVVQREPHKEVNIDLVEKAVPTTDTVIQKEPIEGETTNVQVEPTTSNSSDVMELLSDREVTDVWKESIDTEDIDAHNEATTGYTNTYCVSGKETPVLESVSVMASDVAFTSNSVQEDITCSPDIDGEGKQGEVPADDASQETMETTPTTPADNTMETTPTTPAGNTMETTPTTPADNTKEMTPKIAAGNPKAMIPTTPVGNTTASPPTILAGNPEDTPQGAKDLMYRCSLCSKVFKGKRVSTHAMYHYRRDQCMFCGMVFKNDLLAMMHISEHMEMWKKGKMSVDGEVLQSCALGEPESPESEQSGQPAPRRGSRKRTAVNDAGSTPSDRRKLWSRNDNPTVTPQSVEKKVSTPYDGQQEVQRLNGHLRRRPGRSKGTKCDSLLEGREKETSGQQLENFSMEITREEPETVGEKEQPCLSAEKTEENTHSSSLTLAKVKQADGLSSSENIIGVTETRCPVEGCTSLLRHSLLAHALTCHHGDANPLEAVFRLRNGKCCICLRKFWSFQHYQDHVDSHRESPKHPCLHRGCGERFMTRVEMRRHARRHQPLQAECCFSECPKLFACLWALILHEREHYPLPEEGKDGASASALPTRTVKRTKRLKVNNKLKKVRVTKKQCREKDVSAAAPLTKNVMVTRMLTTRLKDTDKKKQVMRKRGVSKEKEALSAPPVSTPTTFITKETKKLKLKNKLRKTQIKKKRCVSTDEDAPLPAPPNTHTTTKMTKKVNVTDDLKNTQAVKEQPEFSDPLCQKAPTMPVKSKPNVSDGQVIKVKEVVTQAASNTNTTTPVNVTVNETTVLKKHVPEDKDAFPPAPPNTPTTTKVTKKVKVTDDLKETQAVKKQCVSKDLLCQKAPRKQVKSKPNVSDVQVTKVEEVVTSLICGVKEEEKLLVKTTYPTLSSSCDQKLVNGHTETTTELPKSLITVTTSTDLKAPKTAQAATALKAIKKEDEKDTNYGMMTKKPYVRPPPTAYLEERFITMPKRRKEMSWSPHRSPARLPPLESPAGAATFQRQRCTNCFTSFKSAEELQTHLSIKKCTNLFGFDSDEESNW